MWRCRPQRRPARAARTRQPALERRAVPVLGHQNCRELRAVRAHVWQGLSTAPTKSARWGCVAVIRRRIAVPPEVFEGYIAIEHLVGIVVHEEPGKSSDTVRCSAALPISRVSRRSATARRARRHRHHECPFASAFAIPISSSTARRRSREAHRATTADGAAPGARVGMACACSRGLERAQRPPARARNVDLFGHSDRRRSRRFGVLSASRPRSRIRRAA
jgi:hypothetical protein